MHLTIRVRGIDGGRFVATVAELPGCEAVADTPQQAIHLVKGVALKTLAELIEQQAIQLNDGVVFHVEVSAGSCSADAVLAAIPEVRKRYPDFNEFEAEMVRLSRRFRPCQIGAEVVDAEEYIASLYLLAKFSTYSLAPARCPDTAWMLAQRQGEIQKKPAVQ